MTDSNLPSTVTSTRDPDTFEPSGRPVRRAVIALVLLFGLIIALWWSGLAAPRLQFDGASGSYDESTQHAESIQYITNHGPLPVEIVGVEAIDPLHEFTLPDHVRIEAGEQAEVPFEASIDCDAEIVEQSVPFRMIVRTSLGLERRVTRTGWSGITVPNCPRPA